MKRILVALLAMASLTGKIVSQDTRLQTILQPGEELQYKVRWKFLRLGTLTIRTELVDSSLDHPKYRVVMIVQSNPKLPFVDIDEYNACVMDSDALMSKEYFGDFRNGKDRTEIRTKYDETYGRVFYSVKDINTGKFLATDTLENIQPYVDGPSLLTYTRWVSHAVGIYNVPTISNGVIQNTRLDFGGEVEMVDVVGVDYEVRCRRYEGSADWQGGTSAGFSGKFTGWVSDDEAVVVMKAEMKVLLGSIVLELEQWQRPGWNPPSAISVAKK